MVGKHVIGAWGAISEGGGGLINIKSFIIWDKFLMLQDEGSIGEKGRSFVMYKYIVLFCAQQTLF